MLLCSSAFKTKLDPVINCFKKFTLSLPLEPSKHKLALYKSVRAAELSIYRVLIYTFQMGDYRTVVKHWSIIPYSIHPLSCFPLKEFPQVLVVKNKEEKSMSFVTNKQRQTEEMLGFGEAQFELFGFGHCIWS